MISPFGTSSEEARRTFDASIRHRGNMNDKTQMTPAEENNARGSIRRIAAEIRAEEDLRRAQEAASVPALPEGDVIEAEFVEIKPEPLVLGGSVLPAKDVIHEMKWGETKYDPASMASEGEEGFCSGNPTPLEQYALGWGNCRDHIHYQVLKLEGIAGWAARRWFLPLLEKVRDYPREN